MHMNLQRRAVLIRIARVIALVGVLFWAWCVAGFVRTPQWGFSWADVGWQLLALLLFVAPVAALPFLGLKMKKVLRGAVLLLIAAVVCAEVIAGVEEAHIPLPPGAVDVAREFGAKGDGVADDTAALQRAFDQYTGSGRILYLRPGTYLIRNTVTVRTGENRWGFTHLWGAGRDRTTLRLADGTFRDNSKRSPALTWERHGSADWFHNSAQDFTVDVGRDNAGATGLEFYSNNTGVLRNVTIRSADGQGKIGLDLGHGDMNGPLLVSRVRIEGFDTGVHAAFGVNSQVLEHVEILNPRQIGLHNRGQCLSVRGLKVRGAPRPVFNEGGWTFLTLLDADLQGKGNAGIENSGYLFADRLKTDGFASAIVSGDRRIPGGTVARFATHTFGTAHALPAASETPALPTDLRLTLVTDHGAKPNDNGDDTAAIQAALDSGAERIIFPGGGYNITRPLLVPARVRHVDGMMSTLNVGVEMNDRAEPVFRVVGSGRPVHFTSFATSYNGGKLWFFQHDGSRAMVVRDVAINFQAAESYRSTGRGDLYLENVVGGVWRFARQRVWARQFNVENEGTKVRNDGGSLWVLGLKTERGGTLVETTNGGRSAVLGGLCYTTTAGKLAPMFTVDRGELTVSIAEACFTGDPFATILRAGTKITRTADYPPRYNGVALPLLFARVP